MKYGQLSLLGKCIPFLSGLIYYRRFVFFFCSTVAFFWFHTNHFTRKFNKILLSFSWLKLINGDGKLKSGLNGKFSREKVSPRKLERLAATRQSKNNISILWLITKVGHNEAQIIGLADDKGARN